MGVRKVTSKDVAKAAGVSQSTVSFVLNDAPGQTIPDETRQRVLGAARELGYVPHMAARTLARGRSDLVVWVWPDLPINPWFGTLLEQVTRRASQLQLTVAIVHESEGLQSFKSTLQTLLPSAVLSMDGLPKPFLNAAKSLGVPVASLAGDDSSVSLGLAVGAHQVGRLQVEYLANRGHEQLAYLYPADPAISHIAEHRLAGAREAAAELGLPPLRKRTGSLARGKSGDIAREWLDAGVTGVCGYNDKWAIAFMSGARTRGVDVPQDLAVIGCDNLSIAPLITPSLTTIDTDVQQAGELLLAQIEFALGRGEAPVLSAGIGMRVICRESA